MQGTAGESAGWSTGGVLYDAAGNLLTWNLNAYGYDPLNMMTEICTSGSFVACNGERWVHIYTADDERLWSLNAKTGREVWTVRDFAARLLTRDVQDPKQMSQGAGGRGGAACPGSNPLFCDGFESGGTGGWTRVSQGRDVSDYIWRGDKLLGAAYVTGGGSRHFAVDHLGTVRLVVSDIDPEVLAQPNYYPFGREVTTTTQIEEPMKFTGHERDAFDTLPIGDDVDYMHARFRSPVTGRFLSVDTVGGNTAQPQTWNRYTYTLGNPIKFVDPDGQQAEHYSGMMQEFVDHPELAEANARGAGLAVVATAALAVGAQGAALLETGLIAVERTLIRTAASSPALKRLLGQIYKASDRIRGGTAGAIKRELATGVGVGGRIHIQAGLSRLNSLGELIKAGGLGRLDLAIATRESRKLHSALQPLLTKLGMTAEELFKALSSGRVTQAELLELMKH